MFCTVSHEADTNQNHSGTPLLTHQHSYINRKLERKMEGEKRGKGKRKEGGERKKKGGKGRKEGGKNHPGRTLSC